MSQFEEERNIQWLKHEYDKDGDNGPNNVNSVNIYPSISESNDIIFDIYKTKDVNHDI